jgi:hypothetical protein
MAPLRRRLTPGPRGIGRRLCKEPAQSDERCWSYLEHSLPRTSAPVTRPTEGLFPSHPAVFGCVSKGTARRRIGAPFRAGVGLARLFSCAESGTR